MNAGLSSHRPASPLNQAGRGFAAFWGGFIAPTWVSLALMLLAFAGSVGLACAVITPQLITGPLGKYLPRSPNDTEGFVTREAMQLATVTPGSDERSHLYVIGNSILAHAFASEDLTATALRQATGQPWRAAILTTPLQGPFDEAALADLSTRAHPGVVVFGIGFDRFGDRIGAYVDLYRADRLGFRSEWQDEQVKSAGGEPKARTGIYAIDNRNFLARNAAKSMMRAVTGKPAERLVAAYALDGQLNPHRLEIRRAGILKTLGQSTQPDPKVMALFAETVQRLKARGSRVILFEEPVSMALFETPADRDRYDAAVQRSIATAHELGAYYCRPQGSFEAPPPAFADYYHVTDAGAQARLREALAACVADMDTALGRAS